MYIQISGGILLVLGVGSIVGPTVAGVAMSYSGNQNLFLVTGLSHVAIILFTFYRVLTKTALASDTKGTFQAVPLGRASTPETANLAKGEMGEDV